MSKCVLLIDQDSVIADWGSQVKQRFEARFPDRKLRPQEEWTTFYLEDVHPDEWRKDIRQVVSEKGFYSSLAPIEGALEALKDIEQNCLGFIEPFICSSPDTHFEDLLCHSEKAQWVESILGHFWTKRLILTKDKTLVRGHILIDDKPEITGALQPTWSHVVFDQPWNRNTMTLQRFSWKDWTSLRDNAIMPSFQTTKE
jgi:5'-nucleotidase